jgi:fructosamine-3-kinase
VSTAAAIARAVRDAGFEAAVRATAPMSGGCIHRTTAVSLTSGAELVAKTGGADALPLLVEEATGLDTLAETGTVLVPDRLGVGVYAGTAVLLMRRIDPAPATAAGWARFGRALAALHARDVGAAYGFDVDNHIGTTEQCNAWCDDWVTFNRQCRLGPQVELGRRRGVIEADEAARLERLGERLDELLPTRPEPALLHGDLWSGNALPTADGSGPTVAVIDPACSVGDGQADLAMMKLFGGFPAACFEAYVAERGEPIDDGLIAVYQLYHLLNHVNIFGRGYIGQAMGVVRALGF